MLLFFEFLLYRLIIYFRIYNGKNGVTLLKFDGLGDLAIMLNALNRFNVPNSFRPLILVTKTEFVEVAKIYGNFDDVIGVEEKKFQKNIKYRFLIYKKVRNTFPQSIINPVYSNIVTSFSDLIVAAVAPPNRIIGPTYISKSFYGKIIRKIKQSVYNNFININETSLHELNHNIKLLLTLGFQLSLSNQVTSSTKNQQLKVNTNVSKFVLISPGSNNPIKNWELRNFINLAIELYKLGHIVKFIGTKSDLQDLIIPPKLKDKIEICTNLFKLTDLFTLISKSDLVISNDSSASHIAEFFNVRYTVISWGVFKGRYFPYPDSSNLSKVIFSSQCLNCIDFCKDSELNAKCLRSISVAEVLFQVNILLNKP
jgi:ADP-heptose:LPS heptosyltransferase